MTLATRALGPALAALLTLALYATPVRQVTTLGWLDASLRWAAPDAAAAAHAAGASTLVVDLDAASLQALRPTHGDWPWSRDRHAELAARLLAAGARAVAFNLEFADRRPGDEVLAAVAERSGRIVFGVAGGRGGIAEPLPPRTGWRGPARLVAPSLVVRAPSESLWPADDAPRLGLITAPLDPDGRLRCLTPLLRVGSGPVLLPPLPLAALAVAEAAPPVLRVDAQDPRRVHLGQHAWPLSGGDCVELRLPARADAVPVLAFARVAAAAPDDAALAARVRGRTVFVGSPSSMDTPVLTPWGQIAGTQWQALAHAALAAGWTMAPPKGAVTALLLAIAVLPVLWNASRRHPRTRDDVLAAVVAGAAIAGLAYWRQQHLAEVTRAPLAATLLLAGAGGVAWRRWRALADEREASRLAQAAAEAADRAKTEFLAHVSHEIRTPLNAVLGMVQLLRETPLDAQQRRYVDVFENAGEQLRQLIDDLLDLSRVEAGAMALESAPLDTRGLLDELAALYASRARAQGLSFTLDAGPDLPAFVRGDRHRLRQALSNLLGNALKFTPSGGVTLRARRTAADGDELEFTVEDTGIGIATERLAAVFEPFAQADAGTARAFGGSGLGLAITRRLARAMGGDVELESRPGAGTTVRLRLPLPACAAPAPVAEAETAHVPPLPGWQGRRLLLAEDNPHNVLVVEGLLAATGIAIDVATDGAQAARRAAEASYDALLMDVHMPRLDGHAATRAIRDDERRRGRRRVPIVALSANAMPADRDASLAAGCDAHLAKPIDRPTLLATLARLLDPDAPTASGATAPDPPADSHAAAPAAAGEPTTTVGAPGAASGAAPGATGARSTPVVDREGAIARLGDPALYERLCLATLPHFIAWSERFGDAWAVGDRPRAQTLAHDLKGLAGALGAPVLAAAADVLQRRLRDGATEVGAERHAVEAALADVLAVLPGSPASAGGART